MTDLALQLHALPEEMASWVADFARAEAVHALAIRFPPRRVAAVDIADLPAAFRDPEVLRVVLTRSEARRDELVADPRDTQGNALTLLIGRVKDAGLDESYLAARCDDATAMQVWKKLRKVFMKHTRTGLTAQSIKTGASTPARGNRYSEGAKQLMTTGGLPLVGQNDTIRFLIDAKPSA